MHSVMPHIVLFVKAIFSSFMLLLIEAVNKVGSQPLVIPPRRKHSFIPCIVLLVQPVLILYVASDYGG